MYHNQTLLLLIIFLCSLFFEKTYGGDFSIAVDTSQDKSSASMYSNAFSNSVAQPILASFPRSYSSYGIVGQVELSGFFSLESFNLQTRTLFKAAVLATINETMSKKGQCCTSDLEVTITNVCSPDLSVCVSYMIVALPKDCGDGKRIDPEQVRPEGESCDASLVHPDRSACIPAACSDS